MRKKIDDRTREELLAENEVLRFRLEEAEETLHAIRGGEVDAIVVSGAAGDRVFTLETAEHPYRVLVESMNEGAVTLATDGTVLYCNSRLAAMLGFPLEKIIGAPLAPHVAPADTAVFITLLEKCLAEGCAAEIALRTGTGDDLPVKLSCRALNVTDRRGISVVITDLSAQKRYEERLTERTIELAMTVETLLEEIGERTKVEESLRLATAEQIRVAEDLREKDRMLMQQNRLAAMGEMIGNIAHQWRQPLNALGLVIQELALVHDSGAFNRERLDASIDTAMGIIMRMSQTIDDFRNFFRPDKVKSLFRVNQVIAKTVALMEDSYRERRIEIELDSSGDPQINGYPNEYSQALLNILMNARDAFMERETNVPMVTVRVRAENGRAVVTVTDNAGGIDEGIMEKIFEPYFTTKEEGIGTGVGLFMAKTIIEKSMGGRLTVRNTGDGAEFRIEV